MPTCETDGLLKAAQREASAARRDVWMVLLVVTAWTAAVALIALGGVR
jgi:hypothetical protein